MTKATLLGLLPLDRGLESKVKLNCVAKLSRAAASSLLFSLTNRSLSAVIIIVTVAVCMVLVLQRALR